MVINCESPLVGVVVRLFPHLLLGWSTKFPNQATKGEPGLNYKPSCSELTSKRPREGQLGLNMVSFRGSSYDPYLIKPHHFFPNLVLEWPKSHVFMFLKKIKLIFLFMRRQLFGMRWWYCHTNCEGQLPCWPLEQLERKTQFLLLAFKRRRNPFNNFQMSLHLNQTSFSMTFVSQVNF